MAASRWQFAWQPAKANAWSESSKELVDRQISIQRMANLFPYCNTVVYVLWNEGVAISLETKKLERNVSGGFWKAQVN